MGKKAAGILWWRWFSGHPLDGAHRTNATWTRPATRVLHPTGHAVRWHHMPRMHRAAIRSSATIAGLAIAVGLVSERRKTLMILAVMTAAATTYGAVRAWQVLRRFRHYWVYVRPLHRALTVKMGAPPARLVVAPDRSKVILGLPVEFTGGERDREEITQAVTAKLAIEAPDQDWSKLSGRHPEARFTKSEPPPAKVMFARVRAAVDATAPHEVVMGMGKKDQVTTVSVDNDSPHIGLSMGSGDGKSTVAKNMAAQMLHHGALLMVLDYKLISHMWARGLPNVSYAGTPAEIEEALVWLKGEVARRNKVTLAGADVEGRVHANVGARILLIAEELNATQNRLKAYWNEDMGCKGRSPGSKALDEVMFLGRQVHVNVLQIGQRLSVKASGSGDARENLGVLIFSDPTAAAWKMLCPQHVQPPASGHLGRLQVVTRKAVRETQGAFLTGQQARDFATSGTVAIPRPDMPCVTSIGPVQGQQQIGNSRADQGLSLGTPHLVPSSPPSAVTLKEAVEAGLIGPTLHAVRKARTRNSDFPEPAGERGTALVYNVTDLYAYRRTKERSR
jgi:hypothetical protein